MRRISILLPLLIAVSGAACSLMLDTESLQEGTGQAGAAGSDASVEPDSAAGQGGSAGSSGASGASGQGGAAGEAGQAGAGGAPPIPPDKFAVAFAQALCANLQFCWGPGLELVLHEEDCVDLYTKYLQDGIGGLIARSVQDKHLTYDPVKAVACVDQLMIATKDGTCVDVDRVIENCKDMVSGAGGKDAACRHTFECGKGLYCDLESGCAAAKCVPHKTAGALCKDAGECEPDLTCWVPDSALLDGGAANGTCAVYTKKNSVCDNKTHPDCEPGYMCLGDMCSAAREAFVGNVGVPCWGNQKMCGSGLSCELPTALIGNGKCIDGIDNGGDCKLGFPDPCGEGYYCNQAWGVTNPVCTALPTQDQTCASATVQVFGVASRCAKGLACVDKQCKPMKRIGEVCLGNEQCYSGLCTGTGPLSCALPGCP